MGSIRFLRLVVLLCVIHKAFGQNITTESSSPSSVGPVAPAQNMNTFETKNGLSNVLTSESVSEGPCLPNMAVTRQNGNAILRNFRYNWTPRTYYVPIASEAAYRSYAETLLGRPANSQAELDSMKLRIQYRLLPPVFITTGFMDPRNNQRRRIQQSCPPVGRNQLLCIPVPGFGTRGTNVSGIATSRDTVVFTDGRTTSLVVRCLNEKVKDYKVLSTTPSVTPETQRMIAVKIKELGFDPSLMRVKMY